MHCGIGQTAVVLKFRELLLGLFADRALLGSLGPLMYVTAYGTNPFFVHRVLKLVGL
jgi:hypothetical protein